MLKQVFWTKKNLIYIIVDSFGKDIKEKYPETSIKKMIFE